MKIEEDPLHIQLAVEESTLAPPPAIGPQAFVKANCMFASVANQARFHLCATRTDEVALPLAEATFEHSASVFKGNSFSAKD